MAEVQADHGAAPAQEAAAPLVSVPQTLFGAKGMQMMARALPTALLTALVLAATATTAQGVPRLRFSARADPLSAFGHTGNIAGAGAQLSVRLAIEGTEYGGYPPPLSGLSLRLAPGVRWNAGGFQRCVYSPDEVHPDGPSEGPFGCPRGATMGAGPPSTLEVAFDRETVAEQAADSSFYWRRGGLAFYVFGHRPVLMEIFALGTFGPAAAGRGRLLNIKWPLIETVPGASYATFTSLGMALGSAIKHGSSRARFSLHMPTRCPRGYLRFSVEARFAAVAALPPQTATASYRAPCPRGSKRRGAPR
jgi:hypothetical protein